MGGALRLSGDRRVTVTLPVTLPALALGRPGATLNLDGVAFLHRPDGDDNGINGRTGGSHLLDQAGNAHRSPPLARIRMPASRSEKETVHHCKA